VAKEVDHIKPRSRGGSDADKNLQGICIDCHRAKTQKESQQRGGGVKSPGVSNGDRVG